MKTLFAALLALSCCGCINRNAADIPLTFNLSIFGKQEIRTEGQTAGGASVETETPIGEISPDSNLKIPFVGGE